MRSTGDIQFFVCRSRIIPEPPFPSQGIAGSGNEIGFVSSPDYTPDLLFPLPLDLCPWLFSPGLSSCSRFIHLLAHSVGYVRGHSEISKLFSEHERSFETFKIFQAILPLFQGNMLYFLSVFVEERLYLIYR